MSVRQHIIPMREFAQAMYRTDRGFARRVRAFEHVFGEVETDTLAVMAQASYFCWFEVEYEQDYTDVCRAIGMGRPTSLHLCRQITPQRWTEMNTYVVGVQRWLGLEHPLRCQLDGARLERIDRWLGDHSSPKEALAEMFVCQLAVGLLHSSLAKLSGHCDPDKRVYVDFTPWYSRHDGTEYSSESYPSLIEHLRQNVRREMESPSEDTEELIAGILKVSQPACQHRFSRYQDIKITSIGALKWRGNIPPDVDVPKYEARDWFEKKADLKGWLNGVPPTTDLLARLYDALGTPTERKKAIVRDFFCGPPEGSWDWLVNRAERDGITVSALFGGDAPQGAPADTDNPRR